MFSVKLQEPRQPLISIGRSAQSIQARNRMICLQMACHLLRRSRVSGERQLFEFWRRRFARRAPKRNLLVLLLIDFYKDIIYCGVLSPVYLCFGGLRWLPQRQQLQRYSGPDFRFDLNSCRQAQLRAEPKTQEQNTYCQEVRYS